MSDPIPTAQELLEDRIKFKVDVAKRHLDILKEMQKEGVTPDNLEGRVKWEIEMEELLFHLTGAMDALLVRINKKLNLGIPLRGVNRQSICSKLRSEKTNVKNKKDLLKELSDLDPVNRKPSWLKILLELRDIGAHRKLLNLRFARGGLQDGKITFVDVPDSDLDILPYLETSSKKMKQFIVNIISKESFL